MKTCLTTPVGVQETKPVLTVNPKSQDMGIPCYPELLLYEGKLAKRSPYEGYYIAQDGLLLSVKVKGGRGKIDLTKPRLHSVKFDRDGYRVCCLSSYVDGRQKRTYRHVYRVIWETWKGPIPSQMTIDHVDDNQLNDRLNNLQLLSRADNTRKAVKGKPSPKRFLYRLYKNDCFLGLYDRKGLSKAIGLTLKDYYKTTPNKRFLQNEGYRWILESVEDTEKIASHKRLVACE